MRVPMLPDNMLPPGTSDSDPYFDMPNGPTAQRRPTPKMVKVACPKCDGNYWADPMRKCSRCLKGVIWVEETEVQDELRRMSK